MWGDVRQIYTGPGTFARAFPLLFAIPVLAEAAQHVVEVGIGMYDGPASAHAAGTVRHALAGAWSGRCRYCCRAIGSSAIWRSTQIGLQSLSGPPSSFSQ